MIFNISESDFNSLLAVNHLAASTSAANQDDFYAWSRRYLGNVDSYLGTSPLFFAARPGDGEIWLAACNRDKTCAVFLYVDTN